MAQISVPVQRLDRGARRNGLISVALPIDRDRTPDVVMALTLPEFFPDGAVFVFEPARSFAPRSGGLADVIGLGLPKFSGTFKLGRPLAVFGNLCIAKDRTLLLCSY